MLTSDGKEIGALRNLVNPRLPRCALRLDPHLARAGEDLSGDEKRKDSGDNPVPRHISPHQVVVVATITVSRKIGVVLVEPHCLIVRQLQVAAARALRQDAFTGFLLRNQVAQSRAFRSGIFRVSMVVVKARAVAQDQVALDFLETQRPIAIDFKVSRLISVLEQFLSAEPARVAMRIFQIVIPFHMRAVFRVAAHELNRFRHHVDRLRLIDRDPILCFQPKDPPHHRIPYTLAAPPSFKSARRRATRARNARMPALASNRCEATARPTACPRRGSRPRGSS